MRAPETIPPVHEARAAGNRFVDTKLFEVLSRSGFIARGLVYAIVGVLAFDLATGRRGTSGSAGCLGFRAPSTSGISCSR